MLQVALTISISLAAYEEAFRLKKLTDLYFKYDCVYYYIS